jgi:hypothetical protein
MLLLEGYTSNFTCAKYYFLCVEFSDSYVNQSFAGQTIMGKSNRRPFNRISYFNLLLNGTMCLHFFRNVLNNLFDDVPLTTRHAI